MEASTYPIQDSPFYQTNDKHITNNTLNKCITTQGYKQEWEPTVVNGYHKPLNESWLSQTQAPTLSHSLSLTDTVAETL